MKTETSNPAARLLALVEKLMAAPVDGTMKRAWAHALDTPETCTVRIAAGIAQAFSLIEETKSAISALPDDERELYLASFPVIERILDIPHASVGWNQFRRELEQPHVLQGLRFCSVHLRKACPEAVLDSETLRSLQTDVAAAISEIAKDTSIPPQLRSLILQHLRAIQFAISEYWVRGPASLQASLEHALGGLVAHRELMRGHEQSRGLIRLIAVIRRCAEAIETTGACAKSGFGLVAVIRDGVKLLN